MPEITLKLDNPQQTVTLLRRAAQYASSDGWEHDGAYHTRWLASQIEGQIEDPVKPAVEEPTEFGSIVRARQSDERGSELWAPTPWHGEHYWRTEDGWTALWSELTDVEVLRVGVDPASSVELLNAYGKGVDDFAAKVRRDLSALRAEAIGAERKDAYDKSLATVAALLGES